MKFLRLVRRVHLRARDRRAPALAGKRRPREFGVRAALGATAAGIVRLVGAQGLACWLPARRAAKVDPMIALRSE